MSTARFARILSIVAAVGLAAACDHKKPTEPDTTDEEVVRENVIGQPIPVFINQSHPWAGRVVRIRDYTGDAYDRCLGPDAIPATNVRMSAQLCWPRGLDSLQLFTIVGWNSSLPMVDPARVALRSVYRPDFCVDVEWGTATGGELIQMYPCHSGANQLFHLPTPVSSTSSSATGAILTKNSNYAMGFEAGAPDSRGAVKPVRQMPFAVTVNFQRWTMEVR